MLAPAQSSSRSANLERQTLNSISGAYAMTTTGRDPRTEQTAPQRQYLVEGAKTRIRSFTRRDVDRWLEWPSHEDPLYSPYNPLTMTGSQRDAWYEDLVHRQGQHPYAV